MSLKTITKPASALYSSWLYVMNASSAMENAIHAENVHELSSFLHDSLISLSNAEIYAKSVHTALKTIPHFEDAIKDIKDFMAESIKLKTKAEIEHFEGAILYDFMAKLGLLNISLYDILENEVKKEIIPIEKIVPPPPKIKCPKLIVNNEKLILDDVHGICESHLPLKIEYIPPPHEEKCKDVKIDGNIYKLQKDKNGICTGIANLQIKSIKF